MIKRLLILVIIMMAFNQAIAVDAITFSYGQGEPAQLLKQGFTKIYYLAGGINAWKEDNLPTVK